MSHTMWDRWRVRRGQCLYCSNTRGEDDLLCDAHLEVERAEKQRVLEALHWASPLVEAAGGYELDPLLAQKLVHANRGPLTEAAWDAVRYIALDAKDDGRREVAAMARDLLLAGVELDRVLAKLEEHL